MKKFFALLLAVLMFGTSVQPMEDGSTELDEMDHGQKPEMSVVNKDEIDRELEELLDQLNARGKDVSVAFKFTATGETYYYNADEWYYTASLCKLPVAMTYANKLKTGEIQRKTGKVGDSWALEKILVNSSYSWYSNVAKKIYGSVDSPEQREQDLEYSGMDKSLLPDDYLTAQKYSARFFLGIIEELYDNSEEYPDVIEKMEKASPFEFFRFKLGKKYDVAQKYASDKNVVHTAGIIYTECPILLVVMTSSEDDSFGNKIIGGIAEYFAGKAAGWSEDYLCRADVRERILDRIRDALLPAISS